MNNFKTWLKKSAVARILLVHIEDMGVVGSTNNGLYLSTHPITVAAGIGIEYLPIIEGTVNIQESISLEYLPTVNYGDIEINNSKGDYDSWISAIWTNKRVTIYVGERSPGYDYNQLYNNFEPVFVGYVADIDSKSRSRLNIKIRDNLQPANTSISSDLLGNYYQGEIVPTYIYNNTYANNLKPIVLGEVNNITPLLIDPSRLEYMVNNTAVESILEVRDNGVPVQFSPVYGTGKFILLKTPVGAVTCAVQGTKEAIIFAQFPWSGDQIGAQPLYVNTAASIIARLLYNKTGMHWGYSFDYNSFTTVCQESVGVYLTSRVNLLSLCQEIAKSCGVVLTTTREGYMKLVKLEIIDQSALFDPNSLNNISVIEEKDTLFNSLQLTKKLDVVAGVKIGYAKNWTVQPGLLTSIPEQHKSLLGTEWLEAIAKDTNVASTYKITVEPDLETSYLINSTEATEVANDKLSLVKKQRKVFSLVCSTQYMYLQPGDPIILSASRYNLNNNNIGSTGIVISTKPDWIRGTIALEVLV